MKEALLIIAMLCVFAYGYFVVKKFDKFLEENRNSLVEGSQKEGPSCVMLTEDLSEEDLIEEIRRFRANHEETRILLYDPNDTQLSENLQCPTKSKK